MTAAEQLQRAAARKEELHFWFNYTEFKSEQLEKPEQLEKGGEGGGGEGV